MPEWIPMFAMPNIKIQEPVEVEGIGIVSVFDERIKALAERYPKFKTFLSQFRTEFGQQVNPSFIMVRDDAPITYRRVDALASFRDALAISVISYTYAKVFQFGRGGEFGPQYSNAFSFYPWMLDKTYDAVTTQSMALLGYENEVAKMQPQSTPAISITWLVPQQIDRALLSALLKRWQRRYSGRSPSWKDRALFRSLNMANAAAMWCRRESGWNSDDAISDAHEVIVSSGEVNRLIDGLCGERLPSVDLAHVDLPGGEQRPEQHGGGFGGRQHGLRLDPSLELLVQPLDRICGACAAPLARRQTGEG